MVKLTPGGLALASEPTKAGVSLPGGWSKAGQSRGNAILNKMAEEEAGGAGSGDIVSTRADVKGQTTAMAQVNKKMSMVNSTMNSFHNNIQTWENIAEGKAPEIGGERIRPDAGQAEEDELQRREDAERLEAEDQEPVQRSVCRRLHHGRIHRGHGLLADHEQPGPVRRQVTEGARDEALKLVAAGFNPEARNALIGVMESDTEGQRRGLITERDRLRSSIKSNASSGGGNIPTVMQPSILGRLIESGELRAGDKYKTQDGTVMTVPANGEKSKSASGKPIIFINGQWEYDDGAGRSSK